MTSERFGKEQAAPGLVVDRAAALLANDILSSQWCPSLSATAKASLKQSPAATVSIASTGLAGDQPVFPLWHQTTPSPPNVIRTLHPVILPICAAARSASATEPGMVPVNKATSATLGVRISKWDNMSGPKRRAVMALDPSSQSHRWPAPVWRPGSRFQWGFHLQKQDVRSVENKALGTHVGSVKSAIRSRHKPDDVFTIRTNVDNSQSSRAVIQLDQLGSKPQFLQFLGHKSLTCVVINSPDQANISPEMAGCHGQVGTFSTERLQEIAG